ncbi:MAG: cadherin-like domain-containing protein, partial [Magnetospirillum sp.]
AAGDASVNADGTVVLTAANFGNDTNNHKAFAPDLDATLSTVKAQTTDQLTFEVTSIPTDGRLLKDGTPLLEGSLFTLKDLIDGKISYKHLGGEANEALQAGSESDSFNVTIRDGAAGEDTGTILIKINPVNDLPSVSSSVNVTAYEGRNGVPITLSVTDPDQVSTTWKLAFSELDLQGCTLYLENGSDGHYTAGVDTLVNASTVFTGTLAQLNAKLRLDVSGAEPTNPVTFKVTVTDDDGGTIDANVTAGDGASVSTTITINLVENNDHPVLTNTGADQANPIYAGDNNYSIIVTTAMLGIVDVDSPTTTLAFTLTSGIIRDSGNGTAYLLLDGQALSNGGSFTYQVIIDGKVQLMLTGGSSVNDFHFDFKLRDGEITAFSAVRQVEDPIDGGTRNVGDTAYLSHSFYFRFDTPAGSGGSYTPEPANQAPVIDQIIGIRATDLSEGGTVTLKGDGSGPGLVITDNDNTDSEITIRLETLPTGGTILLNGAAVPLYGSFTYADLKAGKVTYRHEGGEYFQSSNLGFTFSVTDGSSVPVTPAVNSQAYDANDFDPAHNFSVEATPVNDTPSVAVDMTAVVKEGGSLTFNTSGQPTLTLSDVDGSGDAAPASLDTYESAGADQLYVTVGVLPSHGTLIYDGTTINAGNMAILKLLKSDIAAGKLVYQHDGSETTADSFQITVNDQQGQGNSVGNTVTVAIQVAPVNDTPLIDPSTPNAPNTVGTINTGLRVVEGGTGTIGGSNALYGGTAFSTVMDGQGRAQLISIDPDNTTTQIQYRIIDNVDVGKLMLNGQVLGVGSTFTQDDLDNGRVTYVHVTGNGAGQGLVTDSFSYEVGDAGPGTYPTGTFDIEVWTRTNDSPVISGGGTTINIDDVAAASNPITGLSISDADFPGNDGQIQVVVRLTAANGTPLAVGDYAGYTITSGASGSGVSVDPTLDGTDAALRISGTIAQVNSYLAGLQFGSTNDPNTTLKLEVIADDRTYSGGNPQSDANGGDQNQNQTEGGNPVAIGTTAIDPYTTLVSAFGGYNVVSKTVSLRISPIDQSATVTVPGAQTANEDVGTVITGISVSDPEASGFGINTTVTLSVGSGKVSVGSQAGVTVSNNGTGTVTLTGSPANINTLLAAGVTYTSAANSHIDTNGAADGDVTLTVKIQEGSAAIGNEAGGTPGDDATTQTVAISINPVNDAPGVSQSGTAIAVGDPNTAVDVTGFSVTDKDIFGDAGNLNSAEGELDFVQVTVRLLDQNGTPLTVGSYAGVTIAVTSSGGLVTDTTLDGTDAALQIRGTLSEVNTALAGLKLTLGNVLGNTDQPYRVQVVVDDRARDASGALNAAGSDANGGELNNSNGATSAQAVPTTVFDPYAALPSLYNLSSTTRIIYPSSGNEVPTLDKPTGANATEDTRSFIGGDLVVGDTESDNFNLPVQLTLSTGGHGILSVGGSSTSADGTTIAGTNVKVVSGDETGTVVLEGKASDIQALLNDATKGLFYTSAANSNNDLNGAAAGDVTIGLSLNEYQSATVFGKVAQTVTASFGVTVAPLNDVPSLSGTSLDPMAPLKANGGGTTAVALVSGAGASDIDFGDTGISTFGGGSLTISFTDAYRTGDRLTLTGSPSGVASTSGGNGAALVVTLTSGATAADVKAIIEAVRYHSVDADPTNGGADADRHFSIVLNDGNNDNGTSNAGGPAALNSSALTGIITFGYTNPTAQNNTATVTRSTAETDNGNLLTDNDGSGVDSDPEADPLKVSLVGGVTVPGAGTVDVVGTYGTLRVAADGTYTYRLDPANADVIALGEGATLTETFHYTITDTQRTGSADLVVTVKAPVKTSEPPVVITPPPAEPPAPVAPVVTAPPPPSTLVLYTPPSAAVTQKDGVPPDSNLRDFNSRPMEYAHAWGGDRPSEVDLLLVGSVSNRFIIPNQPSSIEVPPNIFRHTNPNEPLAFEARRPDGSPLPKWLVFDARNLTFKGTPPDNAKGAVDIVIVAKDTNGNKAEAQFRILVGQNVGEDAPVQDGILPPAAEAPELSPNQVDGTPAEPSAVPVRQGRLDDGSGWTATLASGRPAFSAQMREAGYLGMLAQARALLDAIDQQQA